ncbi:MAG: Rieske (2Fe-2S) protein [Propionibacteriaceae bacterium]
MTPDFHRRSLFAGGLGLTLAGLGLSACSSTSSPATAGTTTAAASTPKVKVADVPVGGGMIMKDASYVVTQPTAGTFKAFSKVCTHQGCTVASVSNGQINCTCHGSTFSATDGSVVNGPATKALAETKVTLSGDSLVIG